MKPRFVAVTLAFVLLAGACGSRGDDEVGGDGLGGGTTGTSLAEEPAT